MRFGLEPLRVALELSGGVKASLEDNGQTVIFSQEGGRQVLRYDHLVASDALGRNLPARMEVREGAVSLLVDDSNAIYPLTIDPLFTEVKKLTASDRAVGDRFGISVAVDRDTVVVGAYFDDSMRGAVYVFERNKGGGDNWGEVKKLTASDGAANDHMGTSVTISADTIVVGAPDEGTRGAAYVFDRNAGGADNWGEVKKLTALTGKFGDSVDISNHTIVVGATNDDSVKGAVFIFERNRGGANKWGEVKKVTASDGANADAFGYASAISGDTIVVGARLDDALVGTDHGSAYVFERNKGGFDNWGGQQNRGLPGS